jgi:hypothetical protein
MWTIQSAYQEALNQAKADAALIRNRAEHLVRTYQKQLGDVSRDAVAQLLGEYNRKRLAAVPDLRRYPELRGMRELLEAERQGTREGAGLDDAQAAANADGLYYIHRECYAKLHLQKARCTWVYFGSSDHGTLMGNNLDTSPDEPYGQPEWPKLNEHLVVGGVSSGVFLDETPPEIFPAPVWKLVARYCRTAAEAVEMLTRYNYFWGPGNVLLADRRHQVAMLEKSACRIGVRWSPDGFGFVTAMTAEHPEMNAFLADRRAASLAPRGLAAPCADTRYWDAQDKRRLIINRLLNESRRNPTLEGLRQIMQYRGTDGMVCDNGDTLYPGDPPIEFTIRTQIFCLSEGRALWWTRDNATGAPSWKHPMPEVKFKDVLLWP